MKDELGEEVIHRWRRFSQMVFSRRFFPGQSLKAALICGKLFCKFGSTKTLSLPRMLFLLAFSATNLYYGYYLQLSYCPPLTDSF